MRDIDSAERRDLRTMGEQICAGIMDAMRRHDKPPNITININIAYASGGGAKVEFRTD